MADDDKGHPLEPFVGLPGDLGEDLPVGHSADNEIGVGYFAPWEEPFSGFAEHSRRSVLALATTGVPVQLRSINPGGQMPFDGAGNPVLSKSRRQVAQRMRNVLSTSVTQYGVQIYQLVGRAVDFQNVVSHGQMEPEVLRTVNRYSVIYTVFERGSVTEHFVAPLALAGQVWVACSQNKKVLVAAGLDEERIRVVPMPYFDDDPLLQLEGRPLLSRPPCFYHIGKWEPRKAQHTIVGAFLHAFKPGEAQLWIKTSSQSPPLGEYPQDPVESVHAWAADERVQQNGWTIETINQWVRFIREALSDKRIRALHEMGDVYVTLSHGEGFDMPAFDAKLAGNLMVYTPSGGPLDFCGVDDILVPSTGQVESHPVYRWEKGTTYYDYRIEDAVSALRVAAGKVRSGIRRRGRCLESFRAEHVGRTMLSHLEGVLGGPLVAAD